MLNKIRSLALMIAALLVTSLSWAPPAVVAVSAYAVSAQSVEAQSRKEQRAALAALPSTTTYAIVNMTERRFENAQGEADPNFITATLQIAFNGSLSGSIQVNVTHPVSATKTQVQTAVRLVVNEWLASYEPGNSLNNAHIILGGLSD